MPVKTTTSLTTPSAPISNPHDDVPLDPRLAGQARVGGVHTGDAPRPLHPRREVHRADPTRRPRTVAVAGARPRSGSGAGPRAGAAARARPVPGCRRRLERLEDVTRVELGNLLGRVLEREVVSGAGRDGRGDLVLGRSGRRRDGRGATSSA